MGAMGGKGHLRLEIRDEEGTKTHLALVREQRVTWCSGLEGPKGEWKVKLGW